MEVPRTHQPFQGKGALQGTGREALESHSSKSVHQLWHFLTTIPSVSSGLNFLFGSKEDGALFPGVYGDAVEVILSALNVHYYLNATCHTVVAKVPNSKLVTMTTTVGGKWWRAGMGLLLQRPGRGEGRRKAAVPLFFLLSSLTHYFGAYIRLIQGHMQVVNHESKYFNFRHWEGKVWEKERLEIPKRGLEKGRSPCTIEESTHSFNKLLLSTSEPDVRHKTDE